MSYVYQHVALRANVVYLLNAQIIMVKRIFFVLGIALLLAAKASGQAMLLDKTSDALQKKEAKKAREYIDIAATNELTSGDPRTWYLRAFVYKELLKVDSASNTDYRDRTLEYVAKCRTLDTKKQYAKGCSQLEDFVYNSYFDSGIIKFNSKDYEQAQLLFQKFLDFRAEKPADEMYPEALYYSGYALMSMGKLQKAQEQMEKSLKLNYNNPAIYYDLSTLYQDQGQDQQAYEVVQKGLMKFADNPDLLIARINLLIGLKRYIEAESRVEEYLKTDPRNTDVLLVAGTIYGKLGAADSSRREQYFKKRKETYAKVLSIDPENFTANYNMGITLYNRGVDLIQESDYLDIMVLNELLEKVTVLFKEALPFVQKASKMAPKNLDALKALEGIYYNLSEKQKAIEIRERINKLN
jgi:tetratricopeptide (TPR) repeat protein